MRRRKPTGWATVTEAQKGVGGGRRRVGDYSARFRRKVVGCQVLRLEHHQMLGGVAGADACLDQGLK